VGKRRKRNRVRIQMTDEQREKARERIRRLNGI
jgi:hypothetical protein